MLMGLMEEAEHVGDDLHGVSRGMLGLNFAAIHTSTFVGLLS